jgi:hypothetical protein
MPQCPSCGSELPGLQTLCQKCYDAEYDQVGRPRSFLKSIRRFVTNPLSLSEKDLTEGGSVSVLFFIAFWCSGLVFCWFGGWAGVHFEYSPFSRAVLPGALSCIGISVIASLALARTNLKLHWRVASPVFTMISVGVAGNFFIVRTAYTD